MMNEYNSQDNCARFLLFAFAISVAFLGGCAGAPITRDKEASRTGLVPILLYHHIAEVPSTANPAQRRWTLSPGGFQAQLDWIVAHGYHPVTMAQLLEHRRQGKPLPSLPIVLTFDDGWRDQYESAFPVLRKYGISATFFVITDAIGHSAYMTWEHLQEMSSAGMDIQPHSQTHLKLITLPLENARLEIFESKRILDERLNSASGVFAYPYGSYNDAVIGLVKQAGFEGAASVAGVNNGYLFRKDKSFTLSRYAVQGSDSLDTIAKEIVKE